MALDYQCTTLKFAITIDEPMGGRSGMCGLDLTRERRGILTALQACKLDFPLHIAIDGGTFRHQDSQHLVRLVQQTLDDHDVSTLHHLRIATADQLGKSAALTVRLEADSKNAEPHATLQPYAAVLDVHHSGFQAAPHASSLQPLASYIAENLRDLFADEQAALTHLLSNSGFSVPNIRLSPEEVGSLDQRSNRAFKYAPKYHLAFSLFSGSTTPSNWDIQNALQEYLEPLLASFSSISTFSVDTQVQLYASLSPSMRGPTLDAETNSWTVQRSDLSGFINAAEWPLSPSIGVGPTINFVLYVPSEKQRPLKVKETGGTSWLIPQWGGVQILNPSASQQARGNLTREDLQPIMLTFADQLVSLLGLPPHPASLPLRLQGLTRERAASTIVSASSTLGALARLTLKLTSIAIPDNVATSVDKTIHHLEQACADLREARYDDALKNARSAEAEAEQAFFEPSMVGQVYFPDEHKVAVYVPLLGPMAVPLVMALLLSLIHI